MGKAVDCGRDRIDGCALDVLEKVDRRLFRYELARSSFARDGGEVTRGGNEVRFAPTDVADAGSLRGDNISAAMLECRSRPRASTPSVIWSSRCGSAEDIRGEVASVMRGEVLVVEV